MSTRSWLSRGQSWRIVSRGFISAFFVLAGANHFVHAPFYCRIVPPGFPAPALLVAISGVCEIAGGIGILVRPLRSAAGWGLIALLLAVFPANLYMALRPEHFAEMHLSPWLLWLRLPLQCLLIFWVRISALQFP